MYCSAKLVSGSYKGWMCHNRAREGSTMCAIHMDKHDKELLASMNLLKLKENPRCSIILKTGKNKGLLCGRPSEKDDKCVLHSFDSNPVILEETDIPRAPAREERKSERKTKITKVLKRQVWRKYISKHIGCVLCPNCNINEIYMDDFEAGHVVAESKGGSTTIDNLRPICGSCNRSIGNKYMDPTNFKYTIALSKGQYDLKTVLSALLLLEEAGFFV